jgi:cytochrome c peroxidase
MHNGVFKSLEQVVHFYNTRDAKRTCMPGEVAATPEGLANMGFVPDCWPAPEYGLNVNADELGDLGLTPEEEAQLVAFLRTLNDGW